MMIKLTQDQSLAKLGRSKSRAVNFLLYLFIRRRLSTQGKITEQQYNDNGGTQVEKHCTTHSMVPNTTNQGTK